MATIYTRLDKKILTLDAHEHEIRQTNFGTDWTEVRIGGLFTLGPIGSPFYTPPGTETVLYNTYLDLFSFGLRNSGSAITLQSGCNFIGIRTTTVPTPFPAAAWFMTPYASNNRLIDNNGGGGTMYYGASSGSLDLPISALDNPRPFYLGNNNDHPSDDGGCFYGIKYIVNNAGLSDQYITITSNSSPDYTTVTDSNATVTLTNLLVSSTYTGPHQVQWNDGVSALPLPDSWMLRSPFLTAQVSTAVMGGIRIS